MAQTDYVGALGRLFVFAALMILVANGCAVVAGPVVVLSTANGSPSVLAVRGLKPQTLDAFDRLEPRTQQQVLIVLVAEAPAGSPPVLGLATRRGNELVFTPRYPLQHGVKYSVRFDPAAQLPGENPLESEILVPTPPPVASVRVVAIYPSSDELPENLLKFYIHFSGAMSLGEAYKHVRLQDEKGRQVAQPFLELDEELWNSTMTRFTLFFDPGRIKHGLVSQMQLGPALQAGRTYQLVVDSDWHDAQGRPLGHAARKTFKAMAAERRRPDPARWRIDPPHGESTEALTVILDEPLDHAMLQRVLSVDDADGKPVPGEISISDHERRWSFLPAAAWHAGGYVIAVETILEDVAGNNIQRPFEVDMRQIPPAAKSDAVHLPFEIH